VWPPDEAVALGTVESGFELGDAHSTGDVEQRAGRRGAGDEPVWLGQDILLLGSAAGDDLV
jgi:hypothetical protein